LSDRSSLWALLMAITAHKAADVTRYELRQKRGGRMREAAGADDVALHEVIGREPTPEFALQVAEEFRRLLDLLDDEGLRTVALWKMEGYTVEEMAGRLGCVPRTIERKLRVIRRLWEDEIDHA
jgi:DNA-directed RNA polymerase specialized sigma24 family protein